MNSIIIDDEPDARARLARLVCQHPEITVIGEAQDGIEAVRFIEELKPDLLFLDIQMPGLDGFEVLHSIAETIPLPLVIFVTGYDQYALAAFQANALAYLLKPVEPERLAVAIKRALRLNTLEGEKESERAAVLRIARESSPIRRLVVCHKADRVVLIPVDQVCWFQIEDGIVKAKTVDELFRVNCQLAELELTLPPGSFFRARREVLVSLRSIKEIKPYFKGGFLLIMLDSAATEFIVSERQVPAFRQRLPGL